MPRRAIFGASGTALSPEETAFFRDADPWGFILFARNVETPAQLRALTAQMRAAVGRDCIIMIDQEGGRVARLRGPHWQEWPAPLAQMEAGAPLSAMHLRYRIIGAELRDVGIDANCVPVLDIARAETHPFLRSRCFGSDAQTVIAAAGAAIEGSLAGGVLPVLKHIPGHGRARADSHEALPEVDAPLGALRQSDFLPFAAHSVALMGMTSHVRYRAIDTAPGTQSRKVVDLIRREIGFDGLLMTDDLSMGALSGDHKSRAEAALSAGCDMILHCSGKMDEMADVAAVTPMLSGAPFDRAARACAGRPPQDMVDIAAAMAEYRGMLSSDSPHA